MRHRHGRYTRRGRITGAITLAVLAGLAVAGCGGDGEGDSPRGQRGAWSSRGAAGGPDDASAAIPVKTAVVTRGEMTSYVETHARLEAERWVDVVARTQGLVQHLIAEEGDEVEEGEVLLQLEKRELRLQVDRARVAFEGARATFERTKMLYERKLVSQEDYEIALHQLQSTEVQLQEAQLQLEYADVRASIPGVVMVRNVDRGDLVRPNDVLFSIADLEPLQARLRVPEKRVTQIHEGQEARITVDPVPGRVFSGRVRMINPGVDPASGTVKVTLDVPPHDLLRPGMFATIRIVTDRRPRALIIPKKALVLETDEDDVFAVRDGRAERVAVRLGFVEGDRVEILSGLQAGEQVVTVGHEGLKEGAEVRVVGAGGEAAAGAGPSLEPGADRGALPDSATFVAGARKRGLTAEEAAARYARMKRHGPGVGRSGGTR